MDLNKIRAELKAGNLVLHDKKIYSKDEWQQISEAERKEHEFDLLQLTKKIQL